jgi:hypothetical protein
MRTPHILQVVMSMTMMRLRIRGAIVESSAYFCWINKSVPNSGTAREQAPQGHKLPVLLPSPGIFISCVSALYGTAKARAHMYDIIKTYVDGA